MSGCRVIVGLGNPGAQYENTPHSVGFEAVDAIARALDAAWEEKRRYKCLVAKASVGSVRVILVKPLTFMNLSGEAVSSVVGYHNARAEETLVIQDDIDLQSGRLRIRKGGSSGGHNGIRSVIERLGTGNFIRIKIGVGRGGGKNVVSHVLGKFDPDSRRKVSLAVEEAAKAALIVISEGVDRAMNGCNGFSADKVT